MAALEKAGVLLPPPPQAPSPPSEALGAGDWNLAPPPPRLPPTADSSPENGVGTGTQNQLPPLPRSVPPPLPVDSPEAFRVEVWDVTTPPPPPPPPPLPENGPNAGCWAESWDVAPPPTPPLPSLRKDGPQEALGLKAREFATLSPPAQPPVGSPAEARGAEVWDLLAPQPEGSPKKPLGVETLDLGAAPNDIPAEAFGVKARDLGPRPVGYHNDEALTAVAQDLPLPSDSRPKEFLGVEDRDVTLPSTAVLGSGSDEVLGVEARDRVSLSLPRSLPPRDDSAGKPVLGEEAQDFLPPRLLLGFGFGEGLGERSSDLATPPTPPPQSCSLEKTLRSEDRDLQFSHRVSKEQEAGAERSDAATGRCAALEPAKSRFSASVSDQVEKLTGFHLCVLL